MKLDGVGIIVKDMKTMVSFYRNVLGFEIEWDDREPNVYLVKDDTVFMFYGRRDFEKLLKQKFEYVKGLNGHYEIALSVKNYDEVDEAFDTVVSKGATPVMPPETMSWGQRTCYIADPEGNLIEIGSFNQ